MGLRCIEYGSWMILGSLMAFELKMGVGWVLDKSQMGHRIMMGAKWVRWVECSYFIDAIHKKIYDMTYCKLRVIVVIMSDTTRSWCSDRGVRTITSGADRSGH